MLTLEHLFLSQLVCIGTCPELESRLIDFKEVLLDFRISVTFKAMPRILESRCLSKLPRLLRLPT